MAAHSYLVFLLAIPFLLLNINLSRSSTSDTSTQILSDENLPKATTGVVSSRIDTQSTVDWTINTNIDDNNKRNPRFDLRFDWSNLGVKSWWAQRIEQTQLYCHSESNPKNSSNEMKFYIAKQLEVGGVGSNFDQWSQTMCSAVKDDAMLIFRGGFNWARGISTCEEQKLQANGNGTGYSYLSCFFPKESTTHCVPNHELPVDKKDRRVLGRRPIKDYRACSKWLNSQDVPDREFFASSMEWIFSAVSPLVIDEARRQIQDAFGEEGLPDPEDLVTLHIRWGDKIHTMNTKPISAFIKAVHRMVGPRANQTDRPLHIYVASEDTKAIAAFQQEKPSHWIMHQSGPSFHGKVHMPAVASGRVGLSSLGALLLSMEANYYVVTTISFWSKLINALRTNIVDPRCNNCTKAVNLNIFK